MTPEQIAEETVAAFAEATEYVLKKKATNTLTFVIQRAIEEEREACALAALSVYAEHLKGNPLAKTISTPNSVLYVAAQLIRARGNHD